MPLKAYNVKEKFFMDFNWLLTFLKDAFKSGALDFLEDLDDDILSPLSAIFNIDAKAAAAVIKILPSVFKGDAGIKEILPVVLPVVVSFLLKGKTASKAVEEKNEENLKNVEKPTYSAAFEQNNTANGSSIPFADNDIEYSLNAYFNSLRAS